MAVVAAVLLLVVALLHSLLGERYVVRPLLAGTWEVGLSRRRAERLIRGAWHLTALAWAGLAVVLLGVSAAVVLGLVCLASAVILFACVPGHVAWPFLTAAGVLAVGATGAVPGPAYAVTVALAVVAALVAAGFHIAWAGGVRRGLGDALPQRAGTREPVGRPGPGATLLVVCALLAYVVVLAALALGLGGELWWWCGVAALVVLGVRIIGDGRYVGVTKRIRDTSFARADDRYWTPVIALLGWGGAAALALSV